MLPCRHFRRALFREFGYIDITPEGNSSWVFFASLIGAVERYRFAALDGPFVVSKCEVAVLCRLHGFHQMREQHILGSSALVGGYNVFKTGEPGNPSFSS